MESFASFAPIERVVAKYRADVHQLSAGAPLDAMTALEGHLGRRLPPGLRAFLTLHNGATLFRGSLRIRAVADIAPASAEAAHVFLFADGPGEQRWAWAVAPGRDPASGTGCRREAGVTYVFGAWDGERLDPLHAQFEGWLAGTVAILEARVVRAEDLEELRFEADPEDILQLVRAGARLLARGNPDEAERVLREATSRDPAEVRAWQYLGDALAITDRSAARVAWLRAFRRTELPVPWPGAPCLDAEVLRSLAGAFVDPEKWEDEIRCFLKDRVRDVVGAEGAALVEGAATELARSLVRRGRRREAREVLADLLARFNGYTHAGTPWTLLLHLARVESALGHHDEAEGLIRRLRRDGPVTLRGRGLVLLARIAVTRQEPWAEDILDEAATTDLDDVDALQVLLLRVERWVRNDRAEEARAALDEAARRVRRLGLRAQEAAVCFAEGEVLRLEKAHEAAATAYRRAQELVGDRNPEIRFRAELRLGDLFREAADAAPADKVRSYRAAAERHYVAAIEGFARYELPVREAWALVRVARLAIEARLPADRWLDPARERFLAADLAAGIAVVDSLRGDPGLSLAWHLERSTAQARARHDAQRSRPPWTRADADRPERRLGAHRIAIAACGESVVDALAAEMAATARATQSGRTRAKDPAVLRYVAAVDLLSGHRSYAAAQVLLHHLLEQQVEGVAQRALQGAIARSPNAALVDGLLRCVERPQEHPAPAVAAAAEVLGLRREPTAVRALLRLAGPGQRPVGRRAAIVAIGRIGNRNAVDAVLACLDEPQLAEAAALSLLMLGDRRGIDFHGRALHEARSDLSGHPGELVGRYGGPDHLLLLVHAAEGTDDRALGALQGLGLLGDPRGVAKLLEALHQRESRVVEVAAGALQILTGHAEDLETPGARNRWHAWWEVNRGRFRDGVRHRDGRMFDCGLLIERMAHPDAWTRRTAYDELVITSGKDLAFDADGPWRVQQAHLRGWQRWWGSAKGQFQPGRWYHDGRKVH